MTEELSRLSFLELYRFALGLAFITTLIACVLFMRRIVKDREDDRRERQRVILELQVASAKLEERAAAALEANVRAEKQRDDIVRQLHEKFDKNIEKNEQAIATANAVNEKIADVNTRIQEIVQRPMVTVEVNKQAQTQEEQKKS